jgi:hypothetical protein
MKYRDGGIKGAGGCMPPQILVEWGQIMPSTTLLAPKILRPAANPDTAWFTATAYRNKSICI